MKLINKLVWEKISEIIIAFGQKAITEILADERQRELLDVKLNEECTEYQVDKTIDIIHRIESVGALIEIIH